MTLAAARSVLDQTMSDIELIIVDDGSNDGLLDELVELRRSDDRVSIIRYDRNSGLPALRINSAILRATADIIGYQFEDDLYETTCLETLLKYRPDAADFMVYGVARVLVTNPEGEWIEQRLFGNERYNYGRLIGDNYISNNAVINSRSLFDRAGLYDPHIVMRRWSDYDLWVRFSREVVPIWCPEVVTSVRILEANSLASTVELARELTHRYREQHRAELLAPKNIGDFDVLCDNFSTNIEQALVYRNDLLSQYVAHHLPGIEHAASSGFITGAPLSLLIAKPDFSTSVDVTVGNFAETFPDFVKTAFFREHHLKWHYDPEQYDVLIQYRTVGDASRSAGHLARKLGSAVVYLMDDNMLRMHELDPTYAGLAPGTSAYSTIEDEIREADLVVVYSEQLAADCEGLNPRVARLSTNIPKKYLEAVSREPGTKARFGLITGNVRVPEITEIWEELGTFFRKHVDRAELVVWGLDESELPSLDIVGEIAPFSHNYREYLKRLRGARIDFLLCPLRDESAAKRSKSPIKLLEATAAGAVLIASESAPYQVVKEADCGLLVPWRPGAWLEALGRALTLDEAQRNAAVKRARQFVSAAYSTESAFPTFVTAFRNAKLIGRMRRFLRSGQEKIAYYVRETELGGATLHLLSHARMISELGYPTIFCYPASSGPPNRDFIEIASYFGSEVVALDYQTHVTIERGDSLAYKELIKFIESRGVSLIHGTPYSFDWIRAAHDTAVPIVLSLHQYYGEVNPKGVDSAPDAVHCSSRSYARKWRNSFRVRCTTMAAPIPTEVFARPALPSARVGRTKVLVSGTLQPRKGQLNAVQAITELVAEGRDVALFLAGYDNLVVGYAQSVRNAICEAGLEERVEVAGFVRDMSRVYADADIVLCASDDESMPQSILFAMAHGVPVVTTPVGGVREVLRDGFTGVLCRSNEPGHLAAGIRRVIDMPPEVRERMVLDARAVVRNLAGEDVVLANLLGIYLDAFEKARERLADRQLEQIQLNRAPVHVVEVEGPERKIIYLLGFHATGPVGVELIDRPMNWEIGSHPKLKAHYLYNGRRPNGPIRFRVTGKGCKIHFLKSEKSDHALVRVDNRTLRVALRKDTQEGELWLAIDDVLASGDLAPEPPADEQPPVTASVVEPGGAVIVDQAPTSPATAGETGVQVVAPPVRDQDRQFGEDRATPGEQDQKPAKDRHAQPEALAKDSKVEAPSEGASAGQAQMIDRRWQNWDVGDVARTIEAIWHGSANEAQHRDLVGELLAPLIGQASCSILEVGCGTGEIYRRLVPKLIPNDSYTGVDVSERMLEIASDKFPAAKFLHADGYALPFEATSFDFVVSFEVIGHLPSIDEFLVELLRVTREYSIFSVWSTSGSDVVTVEKSIDDVPFLHREFPRAHIEEAVRKAAPDTKLQIQMINLPGNVVVFVVNKPRPTVP